MPAFVSAMPMVLVESTILAFVSYFYYNVNGSGHYKEGSSFICIISCSIGITRGVKLVNLGL